MFENGLMGDLAGINSFFYLEETAPRNMKQPISSKKIIILNKLIKSGYYIYFFIFK